MSWDRYEGWASCKPTPKPPQARTFVVTGRRTAAGHQEQIRVQAMDTQDACNRARLQGLHHLDSAWAS